MGCNSSDEREAVKEFVKALGSMGPHSWITKNTVREKKNNQLFFSVVLFLCKFSCRTFQDFDHTKSNGFGYKTVQVSYFIA